MHPISIQCGGVHAGVHPNCTQSGGDQMECILFQFMSGGMLECILIALSLVRRSACWSAS